MLQICAEEYGCCCNLLLPLQLYIQHEQVVEFCSVSKVLLLNKLKMTQHFHINHISSFCSGAEQILNTKRAAAGKLILV